MTYQQLCNVSSVVEFQKWWLLKSKIFTQRKWFFDQWQLVKKCQYRAFKVVYQWQKSMECFRFFFNLGGHFFLASIFDTLF